MEKISIYFLSGPDKGKNFKLKKGLVLTRDNKKEGDILVKDPKASNPHAEIVTKKGIFYLKDLDSKNGSSFEGEINDFFALRPGALFQIGDTQFEVKKAPPPPKAWDEIVTEELKNILVKDQIKKLQVINPPLILSFKSGPQKGDKWHIHYGPRKAGSASLDLPILESQAPDICFYIVPQKKDLLFKTLYPEKVLINKKHLTKKILRTGDLISFSSTLIEVIF